MTRHGTPNAGTTLVVGGTGKTGRRVVARLAARGLPVRAGSRSGQPPFDWEDRATWTPALRGVDAAYISYYPDLAVPGAVEAVGAFAGLAVKQGVRRLVLLSGRGEKGAEQAEQAVQHSAAGWTVLRASWFNQNFSENYLIEPLLHGEVTLPVGDVREPFVDADDIADVAVAALTEDGHAGRLYELTGPRLLTFAEAVAEIGRASGRQIRFQTVTMERYAASLAGYEEAAVFVPLLTYLFTVVLDGRNEQLANGVQQALGRQPRDFSDYACETAAAGIWSSSGAHAAPA